ncbi:MAG TPA: SH3 domain-containing protein [Kofleriaceae bacterium]|nr:SH3 domain-containing protein [Kofleriaceae bacterium]
MRAGLVALACALALAGASAPAAADAYLRVISQKAPVHTGPGASYRELYVAERGEVFQVLERGGQGFWFRVQLEDGTTGWILGELVFPFEVVEEEEPGLMRRMGRAIRRAVLGPSPVPHADVEISFSAGALDGEGAFLLRPAWLLDSYFALEGFAGLSPRRDEDLFLAGVGWTLRLMPGAALGPFVHVGIGAAHLRPKADNFTQEPETLMALSAGGGLEITFKKQITVRVDLRNWTLFDPDQASSGQELSGGLAIFF